MSIDLVIADDHPLMLSGLERLFEAEPDFRILARCGNGREALETVRRLRPDLLIVDSRMPFLDGLDVLSALVQEKSSTRVVLLAEGSEKKVIYQAIRLGARGVVLKDMPPETLLQCARRVHAGEFWVERSSASQAVEEMLRREIGARAIAARLTPREQEILPLLCRGLRNKEMAENLSISEATAKAHVRNIYAKLHVKNRVALLRYAEEQGLA
jgi:DNA-binding NarL/FixJ family response regulator